MINILFFCTAFIFSLNAYETLNFQVDNSPSEVAQRLEEFREEYSKLIKEGQEQLRNESMITQVTFQGSTLELMFQAIEGVQTLGDLQRSLQKVLAFAIETNLDEEVILLQDLYQATNQFIFSDMLFNMSRSMMLGIKNNAFYQTGDFEKTLLPATTIGYHLARLAFKIGKIQEIKPEFITSLVDPDNFTDPIKFLFNEFNYKVAQFESNGQSKTLEYMVCQVLCDFYKCVLYDIDQYQQVPVFYGVFNILPALKSAHFLYNFIQTKNDEQDVTVSIEKWAAKKGIEPYQMDMDNMFSFDKPAFMNVEF